MTYCEKCGYMKSNKKSKKLNKVCVGYDLFGNPIFRNLCSKCKKEVNKELGNL